MLDRLRKGQPMAAKARAEFKPVYVSLDVIARYNVHWGTSLQGDKSHSVSFD